MSIARGSKFVVMQIKTPHLIKQLCKIKIWKEENKYAEKVKRGGREREMQNIRKENKFCNFEISTLFKAIKYNRVFAQCCISS